MMNNDLIERYISESCETERRAPQEWRKRGEEIMRSSPVSLMVAIYPKGRVPWERFFKSMAHCPSVIHEGPPVLIGWRDRLVCARQWMLMAPLVNGFVSCNVCGRIFGDFWDWQFHIDRYECVFINPRIYLPPLASL